MEEINVRLANDSDIDRINDLYNSVYKGTRDKPKFEWEFNGAPAGKAIYALAEHKGKVIGTQCIIPYFIITHDNDETILSGKSEDTLVSPDYRGKNIFEKMYALLFDACLEKNIAFIWGFTYASKPFLRLGFQIPFHSKIGLLVLKPAKAKDYFAYLSPKNTRLDKIKITVLSFASWIKYQMCFIRPVRQMLIDTGNVALNTETFSYLKYKNSFGLKLDKEFIDYRLTNNPYSKNYHTCNAIKDGVLLMSLIFNITEQKVGYFIHVHVAEGVTKKEFRNFLSTAIRTTDLKTCYTLRFWGFSHSKQNQEEIDVLGASGFTFINRGISFVWKPIGTSSNLNPMEFVLSRMSSQGTD